MYTNDPARDAEHYLDDEERQAYERCRLHAQTVGIDDPDKYMDAHDCFCEDMPCLKGCPFSCYFDDI